MIQHASPFTEGRLPSLATTEHWHQLWVEERDKRMQLERENDALRNLIELLREERK